MSEQVSTAKAAYEQEQRAIKKRQAEMMERLQKQAHEKEALYLNREGNKLAADGNAISEMAMKLAAESNSISESSKKVSIDANKLAFISFLISLVALVISFFK